MKWLIGAFGGFAVSIIEFLVKKIGIRNTILAFVIPIYASFVALLIAFAGYAILFIMRIWNLLREYFPKMFDYSNGVSGSFGGLPNQTVINSAMEFLNQSGLASAFTTAMTIFISILSLFFALQLYRVILYVRANITKIITDLLTLMSR
ncbi:hypothetical protein CCAL12920_05270 [Campylobacter sp. RM12920]|uniref:Uncharacterized protein n=1 Tax=Campylobacter californiensis TaxID=1032243 RepID=A0ABD4JGX9_9BACT|nr:hypothetical protein [Campylobacter sp. RM12919]MBE2988307.1 hypothetical protein [Campylobacter sp. RM12920]